MNSSYGMQLLKIKYHFEEENRKMNIENFIERQRWIYAKTYADKCPHEYIVRGRINGSDEEFMDFVNYILQKGQTMFFWRNKNQYIYLDGHYYWVCRDGEDDPTTIINRSNAEDYNISIRWKGLK